MKLETSIEKCKNKKSNHNIWQNLENFLLNHSWMSSQNSKIMLWNICSKMRFYICTGIFLHHERVLTIAIARLSAQSFDNHKGLAGFGTNNQTGHKLTKSLICNYVSTIAITMTNKILLRDRMSFSQTGRRKWLDP